MKTWFWLGFALLVLPGSSPAVDYTTVVINEIMVANASFSLEPDTVNFADWVEFYNKGTEEVNLRGCYLSDDPTNPKKYRIHYGIPIPPKGRRMVWCDGQTRVNHVPFKLDAVQGMISLYSPRSELLDAVYYEQQVPDVSFGRKPDGGKQWLYYAEPTPDKNNSTPGVFGLHQAPAPVFSIPGGPQTRNQYIRITVEDASAEIRYTTDGSAPTPASALYDRRVYVSSPQVIRARAYSPGKLPSPVVTQTYLIQASHTLPILSIAGDPAHFWDNTIGMYVAGTNGISGNCDDLPKNWNRDWERPVSVELFQPDGTLGFRIDAGVEIFGGCSRRSEQKSLTISAREQYGYDRIPYRLFKDKPIDRFHAFNLRNSGNDFGNTMFRDALMQGIVKDGMDIDTQAYQPCVVYINGEYWGIQNIREKLNEHYPQENYGYGLDEIDFLENNQKVFIGDNKNYQEMISFLSTRDMTLPQNYETVKTWMDVTEFMNYQIAQIYFANTDWPGNNTKYWRARTAWGRWRWVLYDTDFGFSLSSGFGHNTLSFALQGNGTEWPNPAWSTLVFRKMMDNPEFKEQFTQRFMACFTHLFAADRVTALIDEYEARIEPEMPEHIARWRRPSSMTTWRSNVNTLRTFAKYRQRSLERYIQRTLRLGEIVNATMTVEPQGSGWIHANEVAQTDRMCAARFFEILPLELKAVPKPGYRFVRWAHAEDQPTDCFTVIPAEGAVYTAVFEPGPALVLNEIHYNPSSIQGGGDGEFLELFNASSVSLDLAGYTFRSGIEFAFPEATVLYPQEYALVAANAARFVNENGPVFQWWRGKLANEGEEILLTDRFKNPIVYVPYGVESPWPGNPDIKGFSLSRLDPALDEAEPASWSFHEPTPGRANQTTVPQWMLY